MANTAGVAGASFLANLFEGYFQGKMDRRKANEQRAMQRETLNAGLERERIQQAGMNTRDANSTTKTERDPVADYEEKYRRKLELDKKYGVGAFAPKEPKGEKKSSYMIEINRRYPDASPEWKRNMLQAVENADGDFDLAAEMSGEPDIKGPTDAQNQNQVDEIVTQWQKWGANQNRMSFMPEQIGWRQPPKYGNGPLPPNGYVDVAEIMVKGGIKDPQQASNIFYVRNTAEHLAKLAGTADITSNFIDVNKLQSLPSVAGRTIGVKSSMGKTSIAGLASLILAGWTQDELDEMMKEYSGAPTTGQTVNRVFPGMINANQ